MIPPAHGLQGESLAEAWSAGPDRQTRLPVNTGMQFPAPRLNPISGTLPLIFERVQKHLDFRFVQSHNLNTFKIMVRAEVSSGPPRKGDLDE